MYRTYHDHLTAQTVYLGQSKESQKMLISAFNLEKSTYKSQTCNLWRAQYLPSHQTTIINAAPFKRSQPRCKFQTSL